MEMMRTGKRSVRRTEKTMLGGGDVSALLGYLPTMPSRTTFGPAGWPTTMWTAVGELSPEADAAAQERALEKLCSAYNPAILASLRAMGFSLHDAEDVRQRFFTEVVLGRNLLGRGSRHRGRLRDLIRRSLRNFALNALRDGKAAAASRLEGNEDRTDGETPELRMETAQEVFTKAWGRRVIERAYEAIDEEYRKKGRAAQCDALKPHLVRWSSPPSQAEVAALLGISTTYLSSELNRLRQRFRHVMLALLSEEGGSPQEAERLLAELLRAFSQ